MYRSPEHFLAVLRSLSALLTDMPLPSYDPSGGVDDHPFDVSQVLLYCCWLVIEGKAQRACFVLYSVPYGSKKYSTGDGGQQVTIDYDPIGDASDYSSSFVDSERSLCEYVLFRRSPLRPCFAFVVTTALAACGSHPAFPSPVSHGLADLKGREPREV